MNFFFKNRKFLAQESIFPCPISITRMSWLIILSQAQLGSFSWRRVLSLFRYILKHYKLEDPTPDMNAYNVNNFNIAMSAQKGVETDPELAKKIPQFNRSEPRFVELRRMGRTFQYSLIFYLSEKWFKLSMNIHRKGGGFKRTKWINFAEGKIIGDFIKGKRWKPCRIQCRSMIIFFKCW